MLSKRVSWTRSGSRPSARAVVLRAEGWPARDGRRGVGMGAPTQQELKQRKCTPCEGGVAPLGVTAAKAYLANLPGWELCAEGKLIGRTFVMRWFMDAIELVQKIAEVAEAEDHHPDIHLTGYRRLRIELTTHAIGGLSENDFIMAAKIESLPKHLKPS